MTAISDSSTEKIARDNFNLKEEDLPALFLTSSIIEDIDSNLMKKFVYMGDVR